MRDAIGAALAAPDAYDALFALLQYLVATHERIGAQRIARLLRAEARGQQGRVIMDVLDELRQEGRAEGMREGERKGERKGERRGRAMGRARTLLDLLAARFGHVPASARATILAAKGAGAGARWSLLVLTAPTLEAVLDEATTKKAKRTAPARRRARGARA